MSTAPATPRPPPGASPLPRQSAPPSSGTTSSLTARKTAWSSRSCSSTASTGPAAQLRVVRHLAVGFLARPSGADLPPLRRPRRPKKMLLLTLLIMGVGTAAIGLLPSRLIGVWAPILLGALRCSSHRRRRRVRRRGTARRRVRPAERRGFFGSFAHIGVPSDWLASGASRSPACCRTRRSSVGMAACFLVSVVLLAIGAYIRLSVMETPASHASRSGRRSPGSPSAICSLPSPSGSCSAWVPGTSRASPSTSSRSTCSPMSSPTSAAALAGARRRRWSLPRGRARADNRSAVGPGRPQPVFRFGAWLALVIAFPVAALVQSANTVAVIVVFVIGLGVLYGAISSPLRRVLVRAAGRQLTASRP